jgi:hypothetical protein
MSPTWSFKAIAGIGALAQTIEDRSIMIELQRKTQSEKVSRLRYASPQEITDLTRKLSRFAEDNMAWFNTLRPSLPEALNDRQQDNWDHLFAVADLAAAGWPGKARIGNLRNY